MYYRGIRLKVYEKWNLYYEFSLGVKVLKAILFTLDILKKNIMCPIKLYFLRHREWSVITYSQRPAAAGLLRLESGARKAV